MDDKETLHRYLRSAREGLLAKLDGLSEYDVRRPMTPTGTSLLGLVKHVGSVQLGYFTEVFGRPPGRELPWYSADAAPDADMWVTAEEDRAEVLELFRYSSTRADATIEELPLDARGRVPWWRDGDVTLHRVLVHMLAEVARHAGHADILRELVDGAVGLTAGDANVTDRGPGGWAEHRAQVESAARAAADRWTRSPHA